MKRRRRLEDGDGIGGGASIMRPRIRVVPDASSYLGYWRHDPSSPVATYVDIRDSADVSYDLPVSVTHSVLGSGSGFVRNDSIYSPEVTALRSTLLPGQETHGIILNASDLEASCLTGGANARAYEPYRGGSIVFKLETRATESGLPRILSGVYPRGLWARGGFRACDAANNPVPLRSDNLYSADLTVRVSGVGVYTDYYGVYASNQMYIDLSPWDAPGSRIVYGAAWGPILKLNSPVVAGDTYTPGNPGLSGYNDYTQGWTAEMSLGRVSIGCFMAMSCFSWCAGHRYNGPNDESFYLAIPDTTGYKIEVLMENIRET